ncbi:hypothetical protein BH11MYX2_BH11MYX2_16890 [soil metagenome]
MDEISPTEKLDFDILDRKGRLFRIALSLGVATLVTVVCMTAMVHDGNGPEQGLGVASAGIVAIIMFILVAHVTHKVIVRLHENLRARRR